ncbi:MAG: NADH-quinone oxidoreductase subunit NuoE [Deltaproteobacteria bacterium]|nr:NADH-quinone oxidoreductase subunit NuoE [Deltaproteobacteria bacterium]
MLTAADLTMKNPDLTSEIMEEVDRIIDENKGKPGCLIPVLEDCQRAAGYLPVELQEYISDRLDIPASTIYGVVTFYSFFSMVPKGRHVIKVCLGTACYVRGTKAIIKRLEDEFGLEVGQTSEDRRFSLEAVRCLGACGLAPAMVIDDDTHGGVNPNRLGELLDKYE